MAPVHYRQWLLLGAGSVLLPMATGVHAEDDTATQTSVTAGEQSSVRLNPTGRAIVLTVPAKDGATYLGDIALTIQPDDQLSFPAQRTLQLLADVLDPQAFTALEQSLGGRATISPQELTASGITVRYDPQRLELVFEIPSERRLTRAIIVSPLDRERLGTVASPEQFSAYVNLRATADYLHTGFDDGFQEPILLIDGAVRLGAIVAESDAIWTPGSFGPDFQRLGSRLVYDDLNNLVRWTAGDLQATGRGFQASPDIAGISIFRSYSVLQPQQIIRPRGDRSFRLDRPSTIEVQVNGQTVRRLQLNPGNYDLRDFPFAQGSNDVRLSVIDDTGRTEVLRFNLFLDQTQLAAGLSEFGLYAGVLAPLAQTGPDYTDHFIVSGFYRRGISDALTIGVNAQLDEDTRMVGLEAVFGTNFGTFATNFAVSDIDGLGAGTATTVTFQRLVTSTNGQSGTFSLFAERRSQNFAPVTVLLPSNPFSFEVGGGYSHSFNDRFYAGADARYSSGRGTQRDTHSYRLNAGYRLSATASLTAETRYERDSRGDRLSGFLSLTVRLGRYSSARADYDTRDNRARASVQTLRGQGVGSYNITADVERSDRGAGINFNGNYFANRAELGISHVGTFEEDFSNRTSERTSFRLGTSIALAGGSVSVGRPIYDSFAIITPHRRLADADVIVEPSPFGFTANSGTFGAATQPSLSSYAERTISVDVANARPGTDIGQGSFRVFPPYRSGYRLEVGSDYGVTAIGRMLDVDGEAVSLVSGTATELAHPERDPVTVFTNREGRFGATGLAPGRWRIEMLDTRRSIYIIEVPDSADGIFRVGDITPVRE